MIDGGIEDFFVGAFEAQGTAALARIVATINRFSF
jgi:hypothetical protein